MDAEFYRHVQEKTAREFPPLVGLLGLEEAEQEMTLRLPERYGHMLYPEELEEIGAYAIEAFRRLSWSS